jgi:cysteinyl-tRNA synthetase
MSKSSGDFLRLQSLIERGIEPLAYRYLCMSAHYRSKLRFNHEAIGAAQAALDRLRKAYASWPAGGTADGGYVARFNAEINQDLNLPRALAIVWEVVRSDLPAATRRATVDAFEPVLGLRLAEWQANAFEIPADVTALAQQREKARAAKDWAESDRLRETLKAAGWQVEDGAGGQRLSPIDAAK